MKLSKLVYEIVKNVKYYDDTNFTYDSFKVGDYDNDLDYVNSINNAFSPLNEAIHRLSDRNKIKSKIVENLVVTADMIDISQIANIKRILNIFRIKDHQYQTFSWRELSTTKVFLIDSNLATHSTYVNLEYLEDIPHFTKSDYRYEAIEDNYYQDIDSLDVDLKEYNINDTMCSYIIEYCQGKLLEPIAPELANLHITRAEQYFDDLDEQSNTYYQPVVDNMYRVGE